MAADHRLRLAPSRVTAFVVELAKRVLMKLGDPKLGAVVGALTNLSVSSGEDIDEAFLSECAFELLAPEHRGKTLVAAGPTQPAFVHALVALMNAALGNTGNSVKYRPLDAEAAGSSFDQYKQLAGGIKAGKIKTLVCVGANPAFDAPGDLGMAEALEKLGKEGMFVTLGVEHTETVALSTWALNQAHYLESWGDTRASDGTVAPIQPMIAPIFEPAYSEIEFLAMLADKEGKSRVDGYELVRQTWRDGAGKWVAGGLKNDFETVWRRSLHQGVLTGSGSEAQNPPVRMDALPAAAVSLGAVLAQQPAAKNNLEVAFRVGNVADGRYSNIGWLQELPDVATRVVWDNPVLLSPKTALELGLAPVGFAGKHGLKHEESNDLNAMYTKPKYPTARVAEVKIGGRSVKSPVWIMPGMADNTAILTLGYGRKFMGLIADGVGVNFSPLRSSEDTARGGAASGGLSLAATGETDTVISTQNHWTIDSKTSLLRAVDLPVWKKFGDAMQERVDEFYKQRSKLNFAERLGDLSHTPPNKSIYENPYNRSLDDPDKSRISAGDPKSPLPYERGTPPAFSERPQWAMTIDQSTCTGCGVCTIACQAENNIPVVGKKEVAKGRELTWIRVDRYYTGEDFNNPQAVHHQPIACVHCENAPCEVVCPVNATVHGPEGLNYMTYNRCIGTRYCANNCPYKVRRYNWFDYGVTKFNGGYYGKELVEQAAKAIPEQEGITGSTVHNRINPNLIPPRLRQKLDEISRMQKNPDVTVRSRGVMEKCTFCIQRINTAKIECKLADIKDKDGNFVVPDGFFQTACQQACPSGSIVFGDQLDPQSMVSRTRGHGRSFAILGYLNTRPRTSHMVRVMNPNPKLCSAERIKSWEDPFHHGSHHGSHEGHDHDHGDGHDGHGHSFFDTTKQHEDAGYALSLRVLSTGGRA
jgi:molybdopterin-containing oxidoreductase family iron-sulfur binding subunit